MLDTINEICDAMTIDLRFVLCSNFLLMFIFKGINVTKKTKKIISIGVMLMMAGMCWHFFNMDLEKLFWSIPVASVAYDYIIKPGYRYIQKKFIVGVKDEDNNDIDELDSVG